MSLEFKSYRIKNEWEGKDIDNRLRFIIFALESYMRHRDFHGVRLTCIIRTDEENVELGGVPHSLHLVGEAADMNPPEHFPEAHWIKWRLLAKHFIDHHVHGVDCVIHGVGSSEHLHLEIDPKVPEVDVRLK